MKSWLKREGTWWKKHWDTVVAIATVVAAVGAICWTWIWSNFDISDKVQMTTGIGTLALVIAAAIYAWHTRRLAQITHKQADTSMQMAEEMKEQRYTVSQPLIFPDLREARFPDQKTIYYENLGNGPALKVKIGFADSTTPDEVVRQWKERKGPFYSCLLQENPRWTLIKAGGSFSYQAELACHPGNTGTAYVEYSDIYQRRFLTGFGYSCEKDGDSNCVILRPTEPIYPTLRDTEADHD